MNRVGGKHPAHVGVDEGMLSHSEAETPGQIVMYGADWCGDCRRAKAVFADLGVEYEYVDLVEHPDEVERVLERNNGVQKIPVIVFADDSHLVEPSNDEITAKVDALTSR